MYRASFIILYYDQKINNFNDLNIYSIEISTTIT